MGVEERRKHTQLLGKHHHLVVARLTVTGFPPLNGFWCQADQICEFGARHPPALPREFQP
ncbi:Uncharacterised protein [Mycobacteroides abscessus subsp. abscessus]|nr:Uncharacterised protein [Mycobacteroides abscessus subsp. abscessus]